MRDTRGKLRRRTFALLALACACDRDDKSGVSAAPTTVPSQTGARLADWRDVAFAPSEHYAEEELAAVLRAKDAPLLVALHGRGEAGRGLAAGAHGWRDDYHLDKARARLAAPPLSARDLLGFVSAPRLAALNASLAAHPFEGLAVACPYCPALADRSVTGAQGFASFVIGSLLPKAAEAAGTKLARKRTGIDGVSMGGRLALLIGLSHPEVFGSVGAMQPAIRVSEADELADLAAKAHRAQPFALRLVSSEEDPFLEAVQALGEALTERGLPHEVIVTPGPHDYAWNRGPGSFEMLLWHERVLRGLAPP